MDIASSDDAMGNHPDRSSSQSPVVKKEGDIDSPTISERGSKLEAQESTENRALFVALGTSSCPSLGLGSSSTGQNGYATSNESVSKTMRESTSSIESRLSNDLVAEKSLGRSSIAVINETSGDNESTQSKDVPAVIADSKAASDAIVDLKLPEEVVTEPNDLCGATMSPMSSPDTLRLSYGFDRALDTNYVATLANEDIEGLSPIMPSREGYVAAMKSSPSQFRVCYVEEIMVTHPEVYASTSSRYSKEYDAPFDQTKSESNNDDENDEKASDLKAVGCDDAVADLAKVRVARSEAEEEKEVHSKMSIRLGTFQSSEEHKLTQEEVTHGSGCNYLETDSAAEEAADYIEGTSVEERMVTHPEELHTSTSTRLCTSQRHETLKKSNEDVASLVREDSSTQDSGSASEGVTGGYCEETGVIRTEEASPKDNVTGSFFSGVNETSEEADERKEHTNEKKMDVSIEKEPIDVKAGTTDQSLHSMRSVETDMSFASQQQVDASSAKGSLDHIEAASAQNRRANIYRDLTSAKKNLDASSMAFIERLRGAAHRRKLKVARSRDSLVAKEREHLLSIATANERRLVRAPKEAVTPVSNVDLHYSNSVTKLETYKPFKARPLPTTTGHLGSGGQVGVPKVEKRPTTTPLSPLLGVRRPAKEQISAPGSPPRHAPRRSGSRLVGMVTQTFTPKKARGHSLSFKARPAPPTTGMQGHGGQVGVPKVEKRPATIPLSPCLGKNRRNSLPVTAAALKRDVLTTAKPFGRMLSGSEVSRVECSA